jgi:hypothetical protein
MKYPLAQLQIIKKRKLDEAEKTLHAKKAHLAEEEKKLRAVEKERDKVKAHKEDKLSQVRQALDTGEKPAKIEQMKLYLKEVQEELKKQEVKVKEQQKKVTAAEEEVEIARANYIKKLQDVEKLKEHEKEWAKEKKAELEYKESLEADEIGTARHIAKKQKKK